MVSNQEIILWKVEPLSPSETPPLDNDEEWFTFDEEPAGLEDYDSKSEIFEDLTRAQVATKYLEQLETNDLGNWIKEESFADWFEEKAQILPIYEDLPAPECGQNHPIVFPNIVKPHQHPQLQQQQQQQQQHHHHHHHHHHQLNHLNHQPVVVIGHHLNHHHDQQVVDPTQTLLQEFESVLGDVEACHQIAVPGVVSTLTPPQSPPPKPNLGLASPQPHQLVSLQPLQSSQSFVYEPQQHQNHEESSVIDRNQHHHQQQQQQSGNYNISVLTIAESIDQQWSAENLSLVPLVHANEVAHELAEVDEYVRNCAADVVGSSSADTISPAPPSPCTSSNASSISSEDSVDDPDWSYESAASSPSSSGRHLDSSAGPVRQGRRASNKPYSRPNTEDKRVRKKEQNKNAATRYRQKKKQEIKEILTEEQELVIKNDQLQAKVKDVQREIGYLKGLMRDLFKAKGLLK